MEDFQTCIRAHAVSEATHYLVPGYYLIIAPPTDGLFPMVSVRPLRQQLQPQAHVSTGSALTSPSVRDELALLLPFQEESKGSVGDGTGNLEVYGT